MIPRSREGYPELPPNLEVGKLYYADYIGEDQDDVLGLKTGTNYIVTYHEGDLLDGFSCNYSTVYVLGVPSKYKDGQDVCRYADVFNNYKPVYERVSGDQELEV